MLGLRAFYVAAAALSIACTPALAPKPPSAGARPMPPTAASVASSDTVLEREPGEIFDEQVDVDGLRLHLRCLGNGEPLVVLEAGLGLDASTWHLVQPEVAKVTRACAYDRAGRGLSGPAPYPHDQRRMAKELHALLTKAGQRGPYVLVGHSMGAANVRWLFNAHPTDVAGMVLIDPATEDWPKKVLAQVPAEALPEFWQNLRAWEGLEREGYIAGYEGLRDLGDSLGDRPLLILTAGKPEHELTLRFEMHDRLERLSANSRHTVVKDSGHNIHREAPATVIESIREVVQAARSHSRL